MATKNIKLSQNQQNQLLLWVSRARDSEYLEMLRTEAKSNRTFYYGDQWTAEEKAYYKDRKVSPVTVNRIKPIIKTSVGIYLQNQQDIKLVGNKQTTAYSVQIWNYVFKNAEQKMGSQKKYTRCFSYGLVDKVSYLKYETNPYKTVNGEPELKVLNVFDVDYDPTSKNYDLNKDARYVIEKEWLFKDEALVMYPAIQIGKDKDKVLRINDYGAQKAVEMLSNWSANQYGGGSSYDSDETNDRSDEIDVHLRDIDRVLIRTVWWKELVEGYIVASQDGEKRFTKDKKEMKSFKDYGFKVTPIKAYKLHKTVVYNNQILETEEDPLGKDITDFPIFRFSPLYYDGKNIGMVDNLISLNREENINRTQVSVYLNAMNNSGYTTMGGSETSKQELAENASKDDVIIDKKQFGGEVEKIRPNPFPVGFQMNADAYDRDIKAVSGISDAAMGGGSNEESGRAIFLRTQQNRTQFQDILDNFFNTLEALGTFMFEYLRKNDIYTDWEIKQIVKESDIIDPELMQKADDMLKEQTGGIGLPEPTLPPPPNPEMMTMVQPQDKAQVMQQMQQGIQASKDYIEQYGKLKRNYDETVKQVAIEWLFEQLKSDEFADYSVEVTVSPHAASEALSIFAQMIDLNNAAGGGVIPPDILVEASIIPPSMKQSIKSRFQMAAGGGGMELMGAENNAGNIVDQMKKTEQL